MEFHSVFQYLKKSIPPRILLKIPKPYFSIEKLIEYKSQDSFCLHWHSVEVLVCWKHANNFAPE